MREHWLIPDKPFDSYREYLAAVGGSAVELARRRDPRAIIDEIKRSGLRGRGGAGFPAGIKWDTVAGHSCTTRYVVVNAAEGEPGTFKDRFLLRHNPYATIEGLLIAAHVMQARQGYVAIKASFTKEIDRLRRALAEMTETADRFVIEVVEGPDEYLFGEEKALLNVIEGLGPLPREAHYPPYEMGLFATPLCANPALVSNVETYAHVPSIVRAGADSFRALGTPDTPGTILFTLSGDIARPGVYEQEAGVTLGELFHAVGGGPLPGRRFKAALSGVSSGVIVPEKFDTPADFGSMQLIGAGLGSAGFVLFGDQVSLPRLAQSVARFLYVESCNQCSACKNGLRIASSAIDELFDPARATPDDPERALVAAVHAPQGNRCYLPVQASVLLPSLLNRFRAEFEAQIREPTAAHAEVLIPKMVDFDAATRSFTYDTDQPRKRPDWTYAPPAVETERPRKRRSAPAARPTGTVAVRLAPDLGATLLRLAESAGMDLDRQVEAALREWLRKADKGADDSPPPADTKSPEG